MGLFIEGMCWGAGLAVGAAIATIALCAAFLLVLVVIGAVFALKDRATKGDK